MTQGMVTSLRMKETEMGDRGSKSDIFCKRATSRWFFRVNEHSFHNTVRCTLVAGKPVFGRNTNFIYQNIVTRAFFHSSNRISHELITYVKNSNMITTLDP